MRAPHLRFPLEASSQTTQAKQNERDEDRYRVLALHFAHYNLFAGSTLPLLSFGILGLYSRAISANAAVSAGT
jgi:hypothetical protein